MRFWITLILLSVSLIATAGSGPFGLLIDKSRFADISNKYKLTFTQTLNVDNTSYTAYSFDEIKSLEFNGLDSGTLYFEKKTGVLKCVVLNINTHRYADIESILSKKYKNVERANTPLTDKYAIFEQGNTIIKLDAPVLNHVMRLIYINKDVYARLKRTDEKSEKELREEEAAKL